MINTLYRWVFVSLGMAPLSIGISAAGADNWVRFVCGIAVGLFVCLLAGIVFLLWVKQVLKAQERVDLNFSSIAKRRGGAGQATDALELGGNILKASARFDASARFSHYVALGQHAGTDEDFGRTAAEDKGIAVDPEVKRFRLKVLKDSGQASLKTAGDRAQFEANFQAARFRAVTYTVQGWRQSDGSLWRPNTTVLVRDQKLFPSGGTMLVVQVKLQLSSAGMTAELGLMPPAGYRRDAAKSDTKQSSSTWASVK